MGKQAKYLYSVFVSLSVRKSSTIGRCYVQVPLGEPDQTVSETRVSDIVRWIRAGFRLFRGLSLVGSVLCQTLSLVGSGRVVSEPTIHGPRTLSATRPDQTRPTRTKSVHVEIERTSLRPDKVRRTCRRPKRSVSLVWSGPCSGI